MNLQKRAQHYCHDYEQGKLPQPPPLEQRSFRNLRQETLAFLASDTATQMLQQDVYWPKWDSPWWHIQALKEAGALHEVPHSFLDALLQQADQQLSAPETVFRSPLNTENFSWRFQGQTWAKAKSASFPLLDWLCQPEIQRAFVHQRFYRLCQDLLQVIATVG